MFPVSASHAHFCVGDYEEAAASFQLGLDVEPGSASLTSALANAKAKLKESVPPPSDTQPTRSTQPGAGPLGGMAEMLRGMSGGGPGEGEGDSNIPSFMNNPMMMQMAQQLMANGGMERLMQNPSVANMVGHLLTGRWNGFTPRTISDPKLSDESHAVWRLHAFDDRANVRSRST